MTKSMPKTCWQKQVEIEWICWESYSLGTVVRARGEKKLKKLKCRALHQEHIAFFTWILKLQSDLSKVVRSIQCPIPIAQGLSKAVDFFFHSSYGIMKLSCNPGVVMLCG